MPKTNKSDTIKKRIAAKQEEFIEAYRSAWTVSGACRKVGISRTTYYEWCGKYPDLVKKLEEVDREHNDYAESRLVRLIRVDNLGAIIFYLKSKHPRYKERIGLEHDVGESLASIVSKELQNADKAASKRSP